jgi:hypothetical protein
MKTLTPNEVKKVAGGCGPEMLNGVFEGMIATAGIAVMASFLVGAGVVQLYHYLSTPTKAPAISK